MAGFIQQLMKIKGTKYNSAIESSYHELLASQYESSENIEEMKLAKLKRLLLHAFETTRFYHDLYSKEKIHPGDVKNLSDFSRLPTVTREDLNNHLADMISRAIPENAMHQAATGGSTGYRTVFARDNKCLNVKKASEYRFNSFTGWTPGDKILFYWPALVDFSSKSSSFKERIKGGINQRLFTRQLSLYAGSLDTETLDRHLADFDKFKPDLIRAFPNSLQIFAEHALQKKASWGIKHGIISVGEPLNQSQRELFRKVFNCDVFNCYVSRETGNIACECAHHKGLHVSDELIHLEIDRKNDMEYGEIIVTDLDNYGMPLVRYRIQDASRWVSGKCPCGRSLSLIDISAARLNDYLISPRDGSFISGSSCVHYLLAEGPSVGRFQIVQNQPDHITLRMDGGTARDDASISMIKEKLQKILKSKVTFDLEIVEKIPFLKSGKYQFVVRKFEPDK